MRQLSAITTAELREACLGFVEEFDEVESWQVPRLVAVKLGASLNDAFSLGVQSMDHGREVRAAETRWASRIRAQLDKLATEGAIVKIGAHQTLPTGYSSGNMAHYYTPAAYETAAQKHSDDLKAMLTENRRWAEIGRRLEIGASVRLRNSHRLAIEQWEQLLDKAGW
jgi:hypothetical protein